MFYRELPPPPALADWVHTFWILDSGPLSVSPHSFRVFAEGFTGLHFQLEDYEANTNQRNYATTESSLSIHGQSDRYKQGTSSGIRRLKIVGACLYPFALNALFKINADEMTNRSAEASLVLGENLNQLKRQLEEAQTPEERVDLLSSFLQSRREQMEVKVEPIHSSIRQIITQNGSLALDGLIRQTGYSRRQFERKFNSSAGISPKQFARIIRFHHSLRAFDYNSSTSLAALAHRCGYYDQPHFNRDFKQFSGMTPGVYFALGQGMADNFVEL